MATRNRKFVRQTKHALPPKEPIWRLGVEQFHAMIRTGILTDDDPVEFLEGLLVLKMPKNPPHRIATQVTREMLGQIIPPGWYVDAQEPITTKDSEPEPDVVIVQGNRRDYAERHPYADEVALVIEVSDTTLQRDRSSKKRLYARAGIAEYWIINLVAQQIEVYSKPLSNAADPDYQERQDYVPGQRIPVVLERAVIAELSVHDLLP